ncbi:hypothetical protein E4U60_002755 [Claviceps pazoutovae]|uniref:Uncharacterized protein n=1 Tax=Claviceps pazoutovae TaxID=1649127 RepID=A0A9P7MIK5_9HYPO|nr:hypothetical protein E4U60_002755 [Claviceps pazoutovae]
MSKGCGEEVRARSRTAEIPPWVQRWARPGLMAELRGHAAAGMGAKKPESAVPDWALMQSQRRDRGHQTRAMKQHKGEK